MCVITILKATIIQVARDTFCINNVRVSKRNDKAFDSLPPDTPCVYMRRQTYITRNFSIKS